MTLLELLRKGKTLGPIGTLFVLGGAYLLKLADERKQERLAVERWEDDGGYCGSPETGQETACDTLS